MSRIFLVSTLLSLCSASAVWADTPIKEIRELELKIDAFKLAGLEKPLVIQSAAEAATYFDAKNLAALKNKVDFSKQEVLLFAWRGSGQDRIKFVVLESFPEQIHFSSQRGRTKDLRQHLKVFIVRSNVKCSIDGKPVEVNPICDFEIKENGKWKPGKLPLAMLAEEKSIQVRVRGILKHGLIAIGGETTGTTIRFGKTTWELDLRKLKTVGSAVERFNGKPVVVTGTLRNQKGIEIATRTILYVDSISNRPLIVGGGTDTIVQANPERVTPNEPPRRAAHFEFVVDPSLEAHLAISGGSNVPDKFVWQASRKYRIDGKMHVLDYSINGREHTLSAGGKTFELAKGNYFRFHLFSGPSFHVDQLPVIDTIGDAASEDVQSQVAAVFDAHPPRTEIPKSSRTAIPVAKTDSLSPVERNLKILGERVPN